MDTREAYNRWAESYDNVVNKTRDLELLAARQALQHTDLTRVLEIGCGTGKNTTWISEQAQELTAVDFSEEMMNIARQKILSPKVKFLQADISKEWNFGKATLITCSLVLEHIENIDFIFEQVSKSLEPGGCFYLCELHPYKQLQASRARFEHEGETIQLEYFVHHISDYFRAAHNQQLQCIELKEWFDDNDTKLLPRVVSFVFQNRGSRNLLSENP